MKNDKRRAAFIEAADDLFVQKGIANTSVGDIANRAGVTRSLFYHYFNDKQDITDAVIEKRIDEFMDYLREWTLSLGGGSFRDSLRRLVGVMRSFLNGPTSLGSRVIYEQDASLYQRFVVRSSKLLSQHFVDSRGIRGSLIDYTHVRHPQESFYVLSVGIMSIMIREPDIGDEIIADLIAETLHIDLSQSV